MDATNSQTDVSHTESVLLTAEQVAAMLACSVRHVRRLADRSAMPKAVKLGSLVRWRREDIEQWIAAGCPAGKAGKP